jgi:uncharacterized protein (TIGR00290 family)
MPKTLISWSSGKDSAWTLHVLRQQGLHEIAGLVTTINEAFDRVAMHAVPVPLLERQAASAELPLWQVPIPHRCSNAEYEQAMRDLFVRARAAGVTHMAFGDLFLEDIRAYREQQLAGSGLTPLFPLWQRPTRALAVEMLAAGVAAVLTCVDPRLLPAPFAGRTFDGALLDDLPATVDPCGERGEFHTFAYSGPMFSDPIPVAVGEIVERDGFVFADVRESTPGAAPRRP